MRMGLVSSAAVQRVGRISDTGTGPVGAVSSDHINNPEQQRAGKGFSNAEADYGPADLGHIDQGINARQWQVRARGENPFRESSWKPEWFNPTPYDWAADWKGPEADARQVTGQSALDRARRGEA
jgi:hypothetical protein